MKAWSSALTTRFSAVKFAHLVEGRGDFEHKDHRVHALIDDVGRKGSTRQKLPVNPELSRWGKNSNPQVEGANWKAEELRAAIITGRHLAFRIGKSENWRKETYLLKKSTR